MPEWSFNFKSKIYLLSVTTRKLKCMLLTTNCKLYNFCYTPQMHHYFLCFYAPQVYVIIGLEFFFCTTRDTYFWIWYYRILPIFQYSFVTCAYVQMCNSTVAVRSKICSESLRHLHILLFKALALHFLLSEKWMDKQINGIWWITRKIAEKYNKLNAWWVALYAIEL